jgi:aminoglycoside phosphotransferase (APT) family kinase protein
MAPSSSGDSATDRLDIERLSRWMLDQGLPIDPTRPIDIELLARGRSNVTYRLHQDERDWVVRRPPFGHVMPSAHDMSREFRVISGMYAGGFAVPTPIALCEDPEVIGAVFHLMGYVPGLVMGSKAETAHLSPQQARELSLELVGTLARLHGIDAEAVGLGDLGRPEGFLQRQAKRWRQQWELSQTRDQPLAIALVDRLDERLAELPDNLPWSVVHGDYRLDNCIVDPESMKIAAVVDWEMSTLGDPLTDLALLCVYWTRSGDRRLKQLPVVDGVTDHEGFLNRHELVEEYSRISGRDVSHLDVCISLSCFKLAVILESIRKRILAGAQVGAAADQADAMGQATDVLLEVGMAALEGDALEALGS